MAASTTVFNLLAVLLLSKDVLAVTVEVTPKSQIVKVGDPIKMLCQVVEAIDYCRIVVPEAGAVSLSPTKPAYKGIVYEGEGLKSGQCGLRISKAEDRHNGIFTCSMSLASSSQELKGNMTLVVARAPTSPPELMVSRPEKLDYYTEGESLTASCVVSNGRPVANLAWYLGENEKITEGLSQPVIYDKVPDDLHTIAQNLTRVIQASDNGKSLRCVAEHPVLVNNNSTQVNIRVHFRPKPLQGPIEYFGLTEGEEGHVTVVVMANPKPTFVWTIGDKDIYEGEEDSTGKFHVKHSVEAQNKGPGNWETVLIINDLSKEDVERNYILTATNDLGNEKYTILISTSPEPKSPEFGAGPIALIVVVVLLILVIVSVLLVARAKGRWCFAGNPSRNAGESSDTESAEHHSSTKPKATFTSVFKKKSDKVSADIDSPKTKDVTVNDEKVGDTEDNGHVALKQKNDEGVVYAELDLQTSPPSRGLLVRPENDKTEYAEIIHTKDGK